MGISLASDFCRTNSLAGSTAVDVWNHKIIRLMKALAGWSIDIEAAQKKLKTNLITEFDSLFS